MKTERSDDDTPVISRVLALPREHARDVAWAAAFFFFAMGSYFVLAPLRDELVRPRQKTLPDLIQWTAGLMLVAQLAFSALAAKVNPRTLVPIAYRGFQLVLLGFAVLFATNDPFDFRPTVTFYVFANVFNLFALSLFWIAQVDVWREADARRVFPVIALGATVGGVIGPQIEAQIYTNFSHRVGAAGVVALSVVMIECALWCGRRMRRESVSKETASAAGTSLGAHAVEGIVATARSPYLLGIAGYLLLYSFTSTFVYFLKQHFANLKYAGDSDGATWFFANQTSVSEGATLVLQLFIAGRFMGRFGVAAALCALPIFTVAGFSTVWFWPSIWTIAVFEIARKALNYAVSRPAREVLFTVVSRVEKSKAKAFIDTVIYRLGDASASSVREHADEKTGLFVPIPAAALWAGLAVVLGLAQQRKAKALAQVEAAASART